MMGMQTTLARRFPFACRVPGTTRMRDNSRGIFQYCRRCTARTKYRKCCRSTVERIDARLRRKRVPAPQPKKERQRLCSRCGKEPALPGWKTGANCQKQNKQSAQRFMERTLHGCARPGCLEKTTGVHCKKHAAELRELKKHGGRRNDRIFAIAARLVQDQPAHP